MVQAPLVLAHFTELMVAVGALHMVAPLIPDVVGSAVGALLQPFYFNGVWLSTSNLEGVADF